MALPPRERWQEASQTAPLDCRTIRHLSLMEVASGKRLSGRIRVCKPAYRLFMGMHNGLSARIFVFGYTISHDLKSPLVTIKVFLHFLEKDMEAQQAEAVAKDFGFIHNAAEKMSLLLEDLLEFSRVGHKRNTPVEVSLQEIAQEALNLVAGQITNRGVLAEITKEPVWLFGDRTRLVEVFQNRIDNAVKFMGEQPAPRGEIGIDRAGDELELFVRDNGKGILPGHQAKVFGLFEKLDTSVPGSGLGLAMAQRIIELHGGTIRVESDGLGCGTTFRFTLEKSRLQPKEKEQ